MSTVRSSGVSRRAQRLFKIGASASLLAIALSGQNIPITVSPNAVVLHVQLGVPGQSLGKITDAQAYTIATVVGNIANAAVSLIQSVPWVIATIQTATPGKAVCCPTTIVASVNADYFTVPGTFSGTVIASVPGTTSAALQYSVIVTSQANTPPTPYPSGSAKIAAVTSAASFSSSQVSAEGYVAIFGSNLADKTYSSPDANYGVKLGSTEVFVCTSAVFSPSCPSARMVFASPSQINAVLTGISGDTPLSASTPHYFIVRVNGLIDSDAGAGKPFSSVVKSYFPSVFLAGRDCPIDSVPSVGGGPRWNGVNQNCGIFPQEPIQVRPAGPLILPSRANRGIVTDLAGNLLWSGNPARLGQFYTVWLTGLGKITSGTSAPMNLGFGDVPAYGYPNPTEGPVKVTYTGAVPQFPGLYQINFQIPLNIGTGPIGYGAWPCGNYSWELSLNVIQGSGFAAQSADLIDIPLAIRNGDVTCKP